MIASERVASFVDSYRHAFEAFDAEAVADRFAFPCHIAGDAGRIDLRCVADRQEWLATLTMLFDVYRRAGVATARVLESDTRSISERIAQASIHWSLRTASDDEIYDFHALYTVVDCEGRLRIAAIAHDELPKIAALLA